MVDLFGWIWDHWIVLTLIAVGGLALISAAAGLVARRCESRAWGEVAIFAALGVGVLLAVGLVGSGVGELIDRGSKQLREEAYRSSLVELAERDDLTADAVAELAVSADPEIRRTVAAHAALPESLVAALAADSHAAVRETVAGREDVPAGLLAVLAADSHSAVRETVAARQDVPAGLLAVLAADSHSAVRETVAAHADLSDDLVVALVCDPDPDVRDVAQARPGLSGSAASAAVSCTPA